MDQLLNVRSQISDHFHASQSAQTNLLSGKKDRYVAYYNSMYLIQDTGEAIGTHMKRGFSKDPLQAYIEFWGIMQGIFIQQDAICELCSAIMGTQPTKPPHWQQLREYRNLCAGHPAKKGNGSTLSRTFMGRHFGQYNKVTYERWDATTEAITHPVFDLETSILEYDKEASNILINVLTFIQANFP